MRNPGCFLVESEVEVREPYQKKHTPLKTNESPPWKSMVGRCIPYWNGPFLGDMLNFRSVVILVLLVTRILDGVIHIPRDIYLEIPAVAVKISSLKTPKNPAIQSPYKKTGTFVCFPGIYLVFSLYPFCIWPWHQQQKHIPNFDDVTLWWGGTKSQINILPNGGFFHGDVFHESVKNIKTTKTSKVFLKHTTWMFLNFGRHSHT